ncbi:hypothetical protein CMV30_00825 [Nibricoccus aquaticus]|uniref:Uncharacterized protein n=1 Tax=Nibricoccus aquaticus TaxID=2576891 RepID=A0A290QBD8_9BACT|nr:hypothetical protein [Nibricoccus aquaticus]ATC62628.1 hypothetical protein CMV30_00825 [Nibricoccus aquaticus]
MNSQKNLLIAALALITVATGVFAWQQHQRAQITVATASDHDALLQKLAAAERHAADLEARLAALQSAPGPETPPAPPTEAAIVERRSGPDRDQGPNNARRAEMMALMNNPEVIKLMSEQQKAGLDNRYAALFKQLNLSPAQLETFKNLLIEKQTAMRDVDMAARESGLNPRENRDELRKLVAEANAETDAAIIAAIGQDKFSQYQNYNATSRQRDTVDQLNNVMSYAASPMTDTQSQALVQILSQGSTAGTGNNNNGNPRGNFVMGGGGNFGGGGNTTITDAMITQAQSVLSSAQLKVLQDQQASQQNAQKLRELMRPQSQARRTN